MARTQRTPQTIDADHQVAADLATARAALRDAGIDPDQPCSVDGTTASALRFMTEHETACKVIHGALCITGGFALGYLAQALGVGVVLMTGSVVAGYLTLGGVIAVGLTLMYKFGAELALLAAHLGSLLQRGYVYCKQLVTDAWDWLKEKCTALWRWLTSFFTSEAVA